MIILAAECSSGCEEKDGVYENFYVTLNSGNKMPMLGLGTWTQSNAAAEQSVDKIKN